MHDLWNFQSCLWMDQWDAMPATRQSCGWFSWSEPDLHMCPLLPLGEKAVWSLPKQYFRRHTLQREMPSLQSSCCSKNVLSTLDWHTPPDLRCTGSRELCGQRRIRAIVAPWQPLPAASAMVLCSASCSVAARRKISRLQGTLPNSKRGIAR